MVIFRTQFVPQARVVTTEALLPPVPDETTMQETAIVVRVSFAKAGVARMTSVRARRRFIFAEFVTSLRCRHVRSVPRTTDSCLFFPAVEAICAQHQSRWIRAGVGRRPLPSLERTCLECLRRR